ncbi:GNAT family N-acetyltransferase [Salinispirillum marinum]|uniref:GNAT family N-acetyltransferase n=2 Tax=Saccharospirillaceae TaxID=255527 RepID=A0ABV8BEL8_9GAMM
MTWRMTLVCPTEVLNAAIRSSLMMHSTTLSDDFPPRRLLILCGPDDWITHQLAQRPTRPVGPDVRLSVGVRLPDHQTIPAKQVQRVLGCSAESIILDWRSGWNTNHLSALSGCIRAGGILVILLADEAAWPQVYAWDADFACTEPPPFFAHVVRCLRHPSVRWRTPEQPPTPAEWVPAPWSGLPPNAPVVTEQSAVIQALISLPEQHAHHILFTAPRGRGKSTALVKAASALARHQPVVLTAPLLDQRTQLTDLLAQHHHADHAPPSVLAWDALPDSLAPDTILMVDEAAAFGLPRLRWLAKQGKRRVFASTTDGYEGSGQGFRLRFLPWLRQQRGGTKELTLHRPLRWAEADALEQLVNAALLQDISLQDTSTHDITPKSRDIEKTLQWWSTEQLLAPRWQTRWSHLLRATHYQTRPEDVRQTLDDAAVRALAWVDNDNLCGLLLSLEEPPIDNDLAKSVWLGTRRPAQQQAKQSIIGQLGHLTAGHWRGQRIWRLAVDPRQQRQGGGNALVSATIAHAQQQGYDYVATSFGLTPELIDFWAASGAWRLVRIGQTVDAASGARSGLWINPLSPEVNAWSQTAQEALCEQGLLQPDIWQGLDDSILLALLDHLPAPPLNAVAQQRVQHWCASQQPITGVRAWVCVAWWAARQHGFRHADDDLLLRLLWRGEHWQAAQRHRPGDDQKALWRRLKNRLSLYLNH